MINITIERGSHRVGLRATGHAGYAEIGKDIVCSAVTTLIHTMIEVYKDDPQVELEEDIRPGDCTIRVWHAKRKTKNMLEALDEAVTASNFLTKMEVIERGLIMLASSYPEYISVDIKKI